MTPQQTASLAQTLLAAAQQGASPKDIADALLWGMTLTERGTIDFVSLKLSLFAAWHLGVPHAYVAIVGLSDAQMNGVSA